MKNLAGLMKQASQMQSKMAEMQADLVVAAHADAKRKIDAMMAEEMEKATGGMQLPGGMKLPF